MSELNRLGLDIVKMLDVIKKERGEYQEWCREADATWQADFEAWYEGRFELQAAEQERNYEKNVLGKVVGAVMIDPEPLKIEESQLENADE